MKFIWPPDTEDEIELKRHLAELASIFKRDYERAAKPYVDRLVAINAIKTPIMFISDEETK